MVDIRRTSNSGSGSPETSSSIQYVDGREPHIHKLWCHGVDGICREVHPYSRIYIPDVTVGEFVTEYFSENWRCNQIIGKLSINGSVQFIGISDICGS